MKKVYEIKRQEGKYLECFVFIDGKRLFLPLTCLGVFSERFEEGTFELSLSILVNHFNETVYPRKWWFQEHSNLKAWKWHREFYNAFLALRHTGNISTEEINLWEDSRKVKEVEEKIEHSRYK